MKTLYLIDGYAQFFRAYHAIRTPMTSPVTKEPTNLTFGFVGMLLKLLRGEGRVGRDGGVDYLGVALDISGDTEGLRSQIYPEYKAHRPPAPEDLPVQVDRCVALLHAIGVPTPGVEGYEADDSIATIVRRLKVTHPDLRIRIVSKDKDLKQLLEPGRVEMYDVHTDQLIDAASLEEETGLKPSQVADMLALMGDTSDNIPGVEGIGPKTAAQLIAQYGSLDELIAHADEIKGKRGERLRETAPRLGLSKELVRLRDDAPVELDLEAADVHALNLPALEPILRELGFNRFLDELHALTQGAPKPSAAAPAPPRGAGLPTGGLFDALHDDDASAGPQDGAYQIVRTTDDLDALVRTLRTAARVSVDTETTGVEAMACDLCGICLTHETGTGWYVPVRSPEAETHLGQDEVIAALKPILEDPNVAKVGHNLKFDLLVLRRHGIDLTRGSGAPGLDFDSMIASYLIDASRSSHSLDALCLALLGRTNVSLKDLIGSGKNERTFDKVPLELAGPYAAEDADCALRLRDLMAPELERMGLVDLFERVEMPLVAVLAELEFNGILVDADELDRQRERLQSRMVELKEKIDEEAYTRTGRTINPDSPKQLATLLFNKPDAAEPGLGIKPLKKTKTGHSTDIEVLEKLALDPAIESEIPALVVENRQLAKLVGTYLVALKDAINPKTGRVHASFNQTVAATGRLSSSDPNLQNIPIRTEIGREIRKAFKAPPGRVLITADYSQIELRLLAHLSRDPALIEAFHQGLDIHRAVAAQIHGVSPDEVTSEQRSGAKMVNFGIVYGITPFGLARRLKVPQGEAQEIIDGYKRRFSGITTFLQECIEQAKAQGYVETMLKRRRPIPDIDSRNPARRSLAERMAINSVVQGSAADLIKLAMVDLHPTPEDCGCVDVKMLLQIHDELVFEAPEGEAGERAREGIVKRMEGAMELDVPLVVESAISADWFGGK